MATLTTAQHFSVPGFKILVAFELQNKMGVGWWWRTEEKDWRGQNESLAESWSWHSEGHQEKEKVYGIFVVFYLVDSLFQNIF